VLTATPLARRVISNRQLEDLIDVLKSGEDDGMMTFTRSLVAAYKEDVITEDAGAMAATNKDEFLLAIQGMETGIDTLRNHGDDATGSANMRELLRAAVRHGASDLHVTAGKPPMLRIDGSLRELNMPVLAAADTRRLLFSVLSPSQRVRLESDRELDFAMSVSGIPEGEGKDKVAHDHRFRVNAFYQKGALAVAVRVIPERIPDAAELGLPQVLIDLARREHGLILVTGPTGHGKSTTLACLIDRINSTRYCHVITVEDPIEYVHQRKRAVVEQREVGADTHSFSAALKYVLRQDPDVILIGEMRDAETIGAALTAAETGHLVLATLHTNDAVQTIDRIIDSFPSHQQNQVRTQLASCLLGVVAQRLIPRADDDGRIACFEIMLGTTPVRSLIRDARTHQIPAIIETQSKEGMILMDKALTNLYQRKMIKAESVRAIARDPNAAAELPKAKGSS
jgi:twitching motility protein PilT